MEIQCPSCQKKLAIGDQFAGQLIKCPACNGVFMAPALVRAPVAAPVATPMAAPVPPTVSGAGAGTVPMGSPPPIPPAPPPIAPTIMEPVIPFSGDPVVPPPTPFVPPPPPPPPPGPVVFEEEAAEAPGEYTTTRTYALCPDVVRWIAPVCVTLIFLLSFFPWVTTIENGVVVGNNLWEVAFGSNLGWATYILYLLLTLFIVLPIAWVKLLLEINVIPKQEFLRPIWPWRAAILGGLILLAYLWPLIEATHYNLSGGQLNFAAFGLRISMWAHLIALIGCGLDHWLIQRKRTKLPLPEMTVRW